MHLLTKQPAACPKRCIHLSKDASTCQKMHAPVKRCICLTNNQLPVPTPSPPPPQDAYLPAHAHAVEAVLQAAPHAPEAACLLETWLRAQGLHAIDAPTTPPDTGTLAAGMLDGMPRLAMRSVLAMLLQQDKLVRGYGSWHYACGKLCVSVPCCAVLCRSVPFYIFLCHSVPFCTIPCLSVLFRAVLCRSVPLGAFLHTFCAFPCHSVPVKTPSCHCCC